MNQEQGKLSHIAVASWAWKLVPWANALLGIILWFGMCTDYAWNSLWLNHLYPPMVGLVGLVSFVLIVGLEHRWIKAVSCLPAMVGGLPFAVVMFLGATVLWPIGLGYVLRGIAEEARATCIEREISPDGLKAAEAYLLSSDPLGESGRIEVRLGYKWLPFVRRDITGFGYVDVDTREYLTWLDNSALHISERMRHASWEKEVEVRWVRWRIPFVPIYLQREPSHYHFHRSQDSVVSYDESGRVL